METNEENVMILAKMSGLVILMVFTFVVLAMCERHSQQSLAAEAYKKHVGKTYVFGNDTISIDSNLNVKK